MIKNKFLIFFILSVFILSIFFFSCPVEQEVVSTTILYKKVSKSNSFSGITPAFFYIDTNTYTDLSYTLSGLNNNEVYYIFTNISTYNSKNNPIVSTNQNIMNNNAIFRRESNIFYSYKKDKYFIKEFNSNPEEFFKKHKSTKSVISDFGMNKNILEGPRKATLGESRNFYNLVYNNSWQLTLISATCRYTNTIKDKTLDIFVADDCWYIGGSKTYLVNPAMIDEIVNKFLRSDTTDDIYTLVTNIYGSHWGNHSYTSKYIPPEKENNVTILLYDIDNDNGQTDGPFVAGFFWAKDNYLNSELIKYTGLTEGGSNELTMFYIDACLLAKKEGLTWEITDPYPNMIISTIVHELQHMIHFYQKVIKNNLTSSSEIWLDEMCSLMTEEFLSSKIGFEGPRGIAYNIADAGTPNNSSGRLPLYNEYNDDSVVEWLDGADVLRSYSMSYAFGAYLARNFGGVNLFKRIVQNPYTNYQAINNALSSLGYSDNFTSVLKKWGVSMLCSDILTMQEGYSYNKADWFDSTNDVGVNYRIGSINMFNYSPSPSLYEGYSEIGYPYYSVIKKASNRYYKRVSNFTGTFKDLIRIDDTVRLTVVVK